MDLKSSSLALNTETFRPRLVHIWCVLAGLCLGAAAVISSEQFGLLAIPVVAFLVLVGPWLVREPFRLFLWLIVTWPLLTFYVHMDLPAGIPDILYERVILLLLFAIVLIQAFFFHLALPKVSAFVKVVLLVTLLGQLRIFVFGGMADFETSHIVGVLMPFAVYWLTKCFLVSQSRLRWLLASLIAATLLICLTGLVEQFLNAEVSFFSYGAIYEPVRRMMDVPGGRASGLMLNPAVFGAAVGLGILACIYFVTQTDDRPIRVLLVALIALLAYGVFASYTRGAWLAVFASLLFALYYMKSLRKPALLMAACFSVVAFGFLYRDMQINEILQSRIFETDNVAGRYNRIVFGWKCFLEKPILGWGSGGYNALIAGSREHGIGGFSASHNSFMNMLVDGGLVHVVSILALLLYWLSRAHTFAMRAPQTSMERCAVVAFASFIVIWSFTAMTIELRYFAYFNSLLWIAGADIEKLATNSTPATKHA